MSLLSKLIDRAGRQLQRWIDRARGKESPTPEQPTPEKPFDPSSALGPASGESEAQARDRMLAWYPNLTRSGKHQKERDGWQGNPSNHLRVKPTAESGGNLVILTPSRVRITRLIMTDGTSILVDRATVTNGHRLTVRFPKHGSSYPNGQLRCPMTDGRAMIADIQPSRDISSTPWRIEG